METRSSQELAQLRDALAARDKELIAMQAEMKALRQVSQRLMAARSASERIVEVER